MTEDSLSELWRTYEKAWHFEVAPDTREIYEERCRGRPTMLEDLKYDLGTVSAMVKFAYSKGAGLKKDSPHRRAPYIRPFMNRVKLANKIKRALTEAGQDEKRRKTWPSVAERFNADNPSEQMTPRELCKAYARVMSDAAVAGTVNAFVKPRPASCVAAVSGPTVLITKRKRRVRYERINTTKE